MTLTIVPSSARARGPTRSRGHAPAYGLRAPLMSDVAHDLPQEDFLPAAGRNGAFVQHKARRVSGERF